MNKNKITMKIIEPVYMKARTTYDFMNENWNRVSQGLPVGLLFVATRGPPFTW